MKELLRGKPAPRVLKLTKKRDAVQRSFLHTTIQHKYRILTSRTVLVKKRKRCAQDIAHLILSESNQRLLQMSIALSFEKLIPMEGGELQEAVKPKEIEKLFIPNSISMLLNDLVTSQKELRPQSMYEIHDSINKILRWFLPLDHESTLYLVAPKKSFLSW